MVNIEKELIRRFPNCNVEFIKKYIAICSSEETGEYREYHHILPRSIWPEYENLAVNPWNSCALSGYNHFIAHYWLAKATNHSGMWAAIQLMGGTGSGVRFKDCSDNELNELAKMYDDAKSHFAHDELTKRKISDSMSGRSITNQHKLNISKALTGREVPQSACNKISESLMGHTVSTETKLKMSLNRQGCSLTESHKQSISDARKGIPLSLKNKEALSVSAKKNMRTGEIWQLPLYKQLWDAWIVSDYKGQRMKSGRFGTHAKSIGLWDGSSLAKLIDHFNNVLENVEQFEHDF